MNAPAGLRKIADSPPEIAAVYEDERIAASYLEKRTQFAWQRLLHRVQARVLRQVVAERSPWNVLELAPGPARLTVEIPGIRKGLLIENSQEMLRLARARLAERGLQHIWETRLGDAFQLDAHVRPLSIDLAYTFRFLRHFRESERFELYRGLNASLRKGGFLVFDVVNEVPLERERARQAAAGDDGHDRIAIYDVAYSPTGFVSEMSAHGFDVVAMRPVIRFPEAQSWVSYKLHDIVPFAVDPIVNVIEMLPANQPLEWVAVCRKR